MVATPPKVDKLAAMYHCPHCNERWVKVLNKKLFVVCCSRNHIWNWCSVHERVALGKPVVRSASECSCLACDEDRTV